VSIGKTLMGKPFEYMGTLATGITVFLAPPSKLEIKREIIQIIREEITNRSPVRMGACRQPLVKDSVGETLSVKHGTTPQVMSYVVPLLVDEGFCTVSAQKPFVIQLTR